MVMILTEEEVEELEIDNVIMKYQSFIKDGILKNHIKKKEQKQIIQNALKIEIDEKEVELKKLNKIRFKWL